MDRQTTLRSDKSVVQTGIQQKHREIKLVMFKVYMDDEFVLASSIGPCWRYDKINKRMIHTKQSELEDDGVPKDQHTVSVITNISNDLDLEIKMTFDCLYSMLTRKCLYLTLKLV